MCKTRSFAFCNEALLPKANERAALSGGSAIKIRLPTAIKIKTNIYTITLWCVYDRGDCKRTESLSR